MNRKTYLGDGAFAEYDGWGVWLTTERENGQHRIYFEPEVLAALNEYVASQRAKVPTRAGEREE
jgi:hypothetical protein